MVMLPTPKLQRSSTLSCAMLSCFMRPVDSSSLMKSVPLFWIRAPRPLSLDPKYVSLCLDRCGHNTYVGFKVKLAPMVPLNTQRIAI